MKLSFLGNHYDANPTEIPTVETGKVGQYRGQQVSFRSAKVAPSANKSYTYRGNGYTA